MRHKKPRLKSVQKPVSTTPKFDHATRPEGFGILKILILISLPLASMWIWGQPALRIQYSYVPFGTDGDRIYQTCRYVTLFNGTFEISPPPYLNNCPLITLVNFSPSQLFD